MKNRFLYLEKELSGFDAKKKKKENYIAKAKSRYSIQKSAAVAAGIGWKIFNILKEGSGLTTQLIRMEGYKYPNDQRSFHNEGQWREPKTVEVYEKHIDGLILKDEISAKFDLRFSYNGHAVGNIDIKETANNMGAVGGWKLDVKTDHRVSERAFPGANGELTVAMVEVAFTYKWHTVKPFENDTIKTVKYELYGNGRVVKR